MQRLVSLAENTSPVSVKKNHITNPVRKLDKVKNDRKPRSKNY